MIALLINHLWQSSLFALAAGLLTLVLRRNGADVRYGLWFAASIKFLVPFALLTAAAGLAAERLHVSLPAAEPLKAIAPVVEPFAPASAVALKAPAAGPAVPVVKAQAAPAPAARAQALAPEAAPFDPAPTLLAVWAAGLAALLIVWAVRWSRIRGALRAATPTALPAPVPVLATPYPIEPGVIGFRRPVVIVPEGIAEQLTPTEWRAVLDHELCHIRRRDNLTGAVHMLVQALFWFHPLVWWLGARLMAERERACDEAVVRGGADARAYAAGILKVCRLYVQQPLAWAPGVSGSTLVARVDAIMNAIPSRPLSRARKALLLAAGAGALAAPVAAGLVSPRSAQAAAAHAAAVTSAALGLPGLHSAQSAAPDHVEDRADAPIVLARHRSIGRPTLSLAALDVAPVRLIQTLAAPQVPVAAAAPPPPPAPVVQPAAPTDPKLQAQAFVQSYAAFGSKNERVARWSSPLCVRVTGLAPEQQKAVSARVEEVAEAVGLPVERQVTVAGVPHGCFGSGVDVEIGFTNDPQATLDDVARRHRALLGDRATAATTVTQPIQAWYVTSGLDLAMNEAGASVRRDSGDEANGLKVPVLYQTFSSPMTNSGFIGQNYATATNQEHGSAPQPRPFDPPSAAFPPDSPRGIRNVMVIVDGRRVASEKLGVIADYVAMLALAQPRALDHCQALPSVTDLFAGPCPGRAAPTGLTPADAAYLTALYADKPPSRTPRFGADRSSPLWKDEASGNARTGSAREADLAERMGDILEKARAAADAGGGNGPAAPRG